MSPEPSRVRLRPATIDDVPTLERWDAEPHVAGAIGADGLRERDWRAEWFPPLRGWVELLIAEVEGRAVGVVQIIDPAEDETAYWGPSPRGLRALDIWIGDAADLGRGYGTEMMRLAAARCFEDPSVAAILLDPLASNTRAHRLYERLGYRAVERRRFGDDDCVVYRLDRPA